MMDVSQRVSTMAQSRAALFLASVLYAGSVLLCLSHYASREWAEYGYSYGGISLGDAMIILLALGFWALLLPSRMESPSSTILIVVYFAVCIPGLIVPLGLDRVAEDVFVGTTLTLMVAFAACCILVRGLAPERGAIRFEPSVWFAPVMVALWVICAVWLVVEYRSIMTLVSLEAIYDQRAAGAATSRWVGYAQTYLGYVISPALLALGLTRKNAALVAMGFVGGVLLYSITAEKNAFSFPFLLLIFGFLITRKSRFFRSATFLILAVSSVLLPSVLLSQSNLVASFLSWYIGVRSLLTPGLFIAQYQEFFGARGHTFWANVTGFGSLVPRPPGLADSRWPSIGHIVGEQYIGKVDLNANANFVATDGIAAFGDIGIVPAFALLALFLIAFDRASRGVDWRYSVLIALPIGLTLTNVSLFTVVLSFGGLFWLLVFPTMYRRPAVVGNQAAQVSLSR